MEKLLELYELEMPRNAPGVWAAFYLSLERLDDSWTAELLRLKTFECFSVPELTEYEQLLVYFLYRHVPRCYDDLDADSKLLFAVLSTQIIGTLAGSDRERIIELARMYSAEIEYSDENAELIYDLLSALQINND